MPDNIPNQAHSTEEYVKTEEHSAEATGTPVDPLVQAQTELAELKAKSAELADQFLRAKAEAENARRRA